MILKPSNDNPNQLAEGDSYVHMVLWHINFYRRSILGLVLVAAVAYLLVHLNDQNSTPEFADEEFPVAPVAHNDSEFSLPDSKVASTELDEESSETEFVSPNRPVVEVAPVTPATPAERIDQLLSTADDWSALDINEAVTFLKKRIVTLKELINDEELTPRQTDYCERGWIDAVGFLVGLSNQTSTGVEGIGELVAEVDDNYSDSEKEETAAAANAVFVRQEIANFIETQSDEDFEALSNALLKRKALILKSGSARTYLSVAMKEAVSFIGDDPRMRKVAIEHLENDVDLRNIVASDLAEMLFFPQMDLDNVPVLIVAKDPTVESDVVLLLKTLKEHPNMPLPIYSIVASSIARYRDIDENKKADRFLGQLREIAPSISIEFIRKEVLGGVKSLTPATPED